MKKAVVAITTFILTLLIIISAYLTLQAKPAYETMENGGEPQESEKASLPPHNPNVDNAEVAENQQGDTSKDSLGMVENSYCRLDQPCEPLSESENSVNMVEKTNVTIGAPPPDRFVAWTEEPPFVGIPAYTTKKWTKIPIPPPDL